MAVSPSKAMMMQRAYSILSIEKTNTEQRRIEGRATTPAVDRVGDVVEPLGVVTASSDLPLLLHHDSRLPVGRAQLAPSPTDVRFVAQLPKIEDPGVLRDRVDEAWHSIRAGLLRGVSIGFRPLPGGSEPLPGGGTRFKRIEVLELSVCTVPANADCSIETIKSLFAAPSRRFIDAATFARDFDAIERSQDPMDLKPITFNSSWLKYLGAVVMIPVRNLGAGVRRALDAQELRLGALEKRLDDMRPFEFTGPHEHGRSYVRNQVVSHQGSMWVAMHDGVATRPGAQTAEWKLAVKHGRDLR